jgi:methyl-accepting chemotaxis protein
MDTHLPDTSNSANAAQWNVSTRLFLGFGVVLVLLVAILAVSIDRMSMLNRRIAAMTGENDRELVEVAALRWNSLSSSVTWRDMVLKPDLASLDKNSEKLASELKNIRDESADLQRTLAAGSDTTDEERKLAASAIEAFRKLQPMLDHMAQLARAHQVEEAVRFNEETMHSANADLRNTVAELATVIEKTSVASAAAAAHAYAQARLALLALGLLCILLASAAALLVTRGILKQLGGEPSYVARIAQQVADGDLSATILMDSSNATSLLALMARMQASLAVIATSVRDTARVVASASAEIAQGNEDLSRRTAVQASALEETAATMEELGSTVRNNAEHCREASQLATSAAEVAVRGGEAVNEVVATMAVINDSSARIGEIIAVIDDLAFQTNLLALNAAVEAARAGEQGRGFAVVASEVRNLAQRSAGAAKEIRQLITESVDRVVLGSRMAARAGATMDEIVSAIQRVSTVVAEISTASHEQSEGVVQAGKAVSQMDEATQQNAALVEQSAAAAERLKDESQKLVSTLAVFKLAEAGGSAMAAKDRLRGSDSPLVAAPDPVPAPRAYARG